MFKNKKVFEFGTKGNLRRYIRKRYFPDINIHPRILKHSRHIFAVNEPYDVMHLRQFSTKDYKLGGKYGDSVSNTIIMEKLNQTEQYAMNGHVLYVMTQDCSILKNFKHLKCLNNYIPKFNHSDLTCLYSQLIAIKARQFYGEYLSTVSQFIMRHRFLKDDRIFCNLIWCWYHT